MYVSKYHPKFLSNTMAVALLGFRHGWLRGTLHFLLVLITPRRKTTICHLFLSCASISQSYEYSLWIAIHCSWWKYAVTAVSRI